MNEGVLIIIIAPSLEEWMVDLLLEQQDLSGFTTSYVNAHGTHTSRLSLLEQVTGRQQKVQLVAYGALAVLNRVVTLLENNLSHSDIRYILMPSLASALI
ncbi:MAG: hypothetical protein B7Y48_08075 [Methylophilales bacterium 28-44-11]|jgi:hypothetical protein|nr:MAG: hypothetical protein B7Y48_08075 [Methylophilales bacterium 28-44-11]